VPEWTTSCPDWESRIIARQSLVPFEPLFPEEAEAALQIMRDLRLVDVPGRPTMGEASLPWVFDLPKALFGSYDAESGRRLIRFFLQSVAKKNTKSTSAAAIMVTALIRNWRDSGEFYILAPTREIADNSFNPARDMVRADNDLHQLLHVQENFRTIKHRNTGAFLKVVAADSETVGGKKTIGLLIDELWLFGKRANAEAMIREAMGGLASRPEGFVIYLTTQSDFAPAGFFAQKLEEFRGIRDGKINDPRSLPLIYEFPRWMIESGEYRNPENFYIPNPNLGASVDEEFLVDEAAKAERAGKSSQINFEAKHLNVQVGLALRADSWAGALVWDRGLEEGLTLDEVLNRSEIVTVGLDGGGLDDLLGVAVLGREKGTKRWLAWAHALISDIGIDRRKANIEYYDQFEREGDLTKFTYTAPVDGVPVINAENIRWVVNLVKRILDLGLLAQVGVDAAGIGAIVDALNDIGVTQDADKLDAVRQGIALMGAIKTIEIKLADYSFRHSGSPMLQWCIGNLKVIPTRTAMMVARDEAGFGKVDPAMALFNAAHLMSLNPVSGGGSYLDRSPLLVI
jgi:phage terminase large subunit-like protein